jgi:hypothetical protein
MIGIDVTTMICMLLRCLNWGFGGFYPVFFSLSFELATARSASTHVLENSTGQHFSVSSFKGI